MTTKRIYSVPDMSCDHCVQAIKGQMASVEGVMDLIIDLDTKTVTVTGGDDTAVTAAIDDAGFDVA
ncbi:MAG: heavy metal-associated domain-containing protein [Acidimicrobiales bacterium]|jgi:copper chaperone CopZ|nr:heavy metal transporter [Acidimicrobiaceae bacterium]MDP6077855.1 heavy metal-associated domain-containing protein [Acidimicrobiales bacterium]MDP7259184.1 heavy metal-associated domain-containing protein [Acidimicrobiales bacterium]HCV35567.1 heavy metal transporter [Acidimicrobiaceae bacterium]HJO80430.1 heavy metal-associated domain-containing protein [Acidimicrobiales bacterium]|tara:strand:+ start:12601 stop:12798 length:198 start_codon:yes stop_codon:yes gene_type:complete